MPILLSTAYLPPVQYLTKFSQEDDVFIEAWENYNKQSYRNRCVIMAANGHQELIIPVVKEKEPKVPVREIRIDYDTRWQKQHWRSIVSAYRNSPFFDYYEDEFLPFYESEFRFLFDYNMNLLDLLLKLLKIDKTFQLTTQYTPETDAADDFRYTLHPKPSRVKKDLTFSPLPYYQVFADRHGFIPNLSVIDLLFNEGPQAVEVLRKSIK